MKPHPTLPAITHQVYLHFAITEKGGEEKSVGQLVLGLFGDIAPRAVENFKRLCECKGEVGKISGKELCYKGSVVHRIGEYQL